MAIKGVMQKEYHVYCGGIIVRCEQHTSYSGTSRYNNPRFAERHFRAEGWSKTDARGWLCPGCSEQWRIMQKIARQEAAGERRRAKRQYVGTEGHKGE